METKSVKAAVVSLDKVIEAVGKERARILAAFESEKVAAGWKKVYIDLVYRGSHSEWDDSRTRVFLVAPSVDLTVWKRRRFAVRTDEGSEVDKWLSTLRDDDYIELDSIVE